MKKDTFEKELPQLLAELTAEHRPLWGIMTAQHMIEHLIVTWKISRNVIKLSLDSDKGLDKKLEFLQSDDPYPKNMPIRALKGQLMPLRYPDLEAAKQALLDELPQFNQFYDKNPDVTPMNPVFGPLDKALWHQLHFKHVRHHFQQFGISSE